VIKKASQTNQQEQIFGVLLIRSPSRLRVLSLLLPPLRSTCLHGSRLSDNCTWREGVLSLKHRRCNETKKYHRAQQPPHDNDRLPGNENLHGRTSGDEGRVTIVAIILRKPHTSFLENRAHVIVADVLFLEPPNTAAHPVLI